MSTDRRTIAYWKYLATQNYKEMEYYKRELEHYKDLYLVSKERLQLMNDSLNDWKYLATLRTDKAYSITSNLSVSYRSNELIECQKKELQKEIELEKQFFECVFVRLNPNRI